MIGSALAVLETEEQRCVLESFYLRYKNRFLYIARSFLKSGDSPEDIVQSAFLDIADKPDVFFNMSENDRLRYFDVIIKNKAVSEYNRAVRRSAVSLDDINEPEAPGLSLEDSVLAEVSREELVGFIRNLPRLQYDVLFCRCGLGLSTKETALRLNISVPAAKERLRLARKAISEHIKERSGEI